MYVVTVTKEFMLTPAVIVLPDNRALAVIGVANTKSVRTGVPVMYVEGVGIFVGADREVAKVV